MNKGDYVNYKGNSIKIDGILNKKDLEILRIKEVKEDGVILDLGNSNGSPIVPFDEVSVVYIKDMENWRILMFSDSGGYIKTLNRKLYFDVELEIRQVLFYEDGRVVEENDKSIPKWISERILGLSKKISLNRQKYVLFSDYLGYWSEEEDWTEFIMKSTKYNTTNVKLPMKLDGSIRWNIY